MSIEDTRLRTKLTVASVVANLFSNCKWLQNSHFEFWRNNPSTTFCMEIIPVNIVVVLVDGSIMNVIEEPIHSFGLQSMQKLAAALLHY